MESEKDDENHRTNFLNELIIQIQKRGLELNQLELDGRWHSFHWGESHGKKKGSYRAFDTEYGCDLYFKNWKNPSLNFSITAKKRDLSSEEKEEHEKKRKDFEDREIQKKIIKWDTAAIEAERIWGLAEEAMHPYLYKKKIKAPLGTRVKKVGHSETLLIPVRDIDGKLWGLEQISDHGKFGISGMRKEDCFHLIGEVDISRPLFICEGFATAATIFETSGHASICAFGSANLLRVADAFRRKYGSALEIILSGDDDRAGKEAAKKAAQKVQGKILIPKFRSPHPDYTDWNDLKDLEGEGTVKTQIEQYKIEARSSHTAKQDWMAEYLEENQIDYKYSGKVLIAGEKISYDTFLSEMLLASDRAGVKISERIMNAFITIWINQKKKEEWARVVSLIAPYQPSGVEAVKAWLRAMTGREDPTELIIMLHFIWQAKRKALNLKVDQHMMPVFIGKTGGGKSEGVKRLIAPLSPLSFTSNLGVCSDPRESRLFEDCLILNMDEMENAEKTDLQALKRTITAEEITHRILGTNKHETVENRATLIGSANEALDFLIKDPTSIRRFYAIESLPYESLSKNWETINSIDYVNLWHAVDPHEQTPLTSILKDVRSKQEDMRYQTDVEQWSVHEGFRPDGFNFVPNDLIMKRYYAYAELNPTSFKRSTESVSRELVRLGFRRQNRGNKRGFLAHFNSDFSAE